MVAVLSAIGAALFWVAVASPAPGDPRKDIKPADQRYAASTVLRRTDLPAGRWLGKPTDFTQPNPECLVRHYSLASLTATGEAGLTYTLVNGSSISVIESDAHVFLSDRQAALGYATLTRAGLARCLGSAFANAISRAAPGISTKVMNVTPLRLTGVHAAPAQGFRILIRFHSTKGDNLAELVLLGVHHGRAVGSLSLVRTGGALSSLKTSTLWPDSVVSSLAQKVVMRIASR